MSAETPIRRDSLQATGKTRGYDPFDYEVHEDPYPVYAWMRDNAPVYRNSERDFWALSRHADVLAALRNPTRFSNRNGISLEPSLWGPEAYKTSSFLAMDPPEHGAMRSLVSAGFTPRRVGALEPRIRELSRARLGPLLDRPTFDFATDFAAALPNDVICDMLGIPASDWDQIRFDTDRLNYREDGSSERTQTTLAAALRLAEYFVGHVTRLRGRPGDDLTSALTQARVDGVALTDSQIVAILFLLISAGNESTGKLIGNAWYHGWLHPEIQRAGLDGRAADWAAETLRYDSSSQMTARTLTEDVVIHDVHLSAGARIVLLPASANRDDRVFSEPDRYDLDRDTSQMISFGHGPHFCLGSALAKLEIRVVLQEVGAMVSSYDIDLAEARRVHSPHQRGFSVLPCTATRRHNGGR